MRLEIWLVDFCEAFARVSRKRQCAKCVSAFRFSFMRVGKKLNLFSFIFILKPFFSVVIVSVSFFFFALLLTLSICKVGDCGLQTYQTVTKLKRAETVEFTTITPILYIQCYGQFLIHFFN